jgi:hypothetical protein
MLYPIGVCTPTRPGKTLWPKAIRPGRRTSRNRVVLCRAVLTITLLVGLVVGVGACGFADRSRQANAISDAIRAIPGVTGVATGYKSDPLQGASFAPIVQVEPSITPAHTAEVVRTFIDGVHVGGFEDFVACLTVYDPAPIPRPANDLFDSSQRRPHRR